MFWKIPLLQFPNLERHKKCILKLKSAKEIAGRYIEKKVIFVNDMGIGGQEGGTGTL